MQVRRVLAAAVVLTGLLALAPAGAAESYSMDGKKKKSSKYDGDVVAPATSGSVSSRNPDPLAYELADCATPHCDRRTLRLALPKQTTWGRFRAVVTAPASLNAALVLFDPRAEVVASDEVWDEAPEPREDTSTYELEIFRNQLEAGTYTLAVVGRAGLGTFSATVYWEAHPRDRRPAR